MPLLLSRYCQCVPQLRLLWHSGQPAPYWQLGHRSQARRAASAWGSIGNTVGRPIRQHSGLHEFVVDPLLLGVEA
jgi:hypothetical protein